MNFLLSVNLCWIVAVFAVTCAKATPEIVFSSEKGVVGSLILVPSAGGGQVSCACSFSNSTDLPSWWFHGQLVPSVIAGKNQSQSKGELFLLNVAEEEQGVYTCKTNCAGQSLSRDLTVNAAVTVRMVADAAVNGSESTVIECLHDATFGNVSLEFFRFENGNKIPIQNGDRYKISAHSLEIDHVTTADAGVYFCNATQTFREGNEVVSASDAQNFTLIVQYAPFFSNMEEVSVPVFSGKANLSCEAEGVPPPHVQFRLRNEPNEPSELNERTEREFDEMTKNGKMIFSLKNDSDLKEFVCVATNIFGSARKNFTLVKSSKALTISFPDSLGVTSETATVSGLQIGTQKENSGSSAHFSHSFVWMSVCLTFLTGCLSAVF